MAVRVLWVRRRLFIVSSESGKETGRILRARVQGRKAYARVNSGTVPLKGEQLFYFTLVRQEAVVALQHVRPIVQETELRGLGAGTGNAEAAADAGQFQLEFYDLGPRPRR